MAKGEIVPSNADAHEADDADGAVVTAPKGDRAVAKLAVGGPGFFTIYKKGQGKWTRLGTAAAVGVLGLLTTYNIYLYALPLLPVEHPEGVRRMVMLACAVFLAGFAGLAFWIANKPGNVDFLIATDSEMKKVNWTTKGELFGSTRVVVLFLVFIAVFLFAVDLVFQEFFTLIGVLKH